MAGRAEVISLFINMYKNAVWPFQDLNFSSKSQLNLLTFSPNCTECGANFYAECHMRFKLTTCGAYVLFVPTAIEFFLYINRKSSQNQSICQLATMQRAFFLVVSNSMSRACVCVLIPAAVWLIANNKFQLTVHVTGITY